MEDTSPAESNEEPVTLVDKVSVKLPPFWAEKPEIWFAQAEAQFTISGIKTETTKFNYLLAQLSQNVAENIWDLVNSKETSKYTAAKKRLLAIFSESEERQIKKLISELELGDLKPSMLSRKMRGLSGTNFSDKILRTFWLDKLPAHIRNILVISDENLDKLSEIGDRIWDLNSVNVVEGPAPSTSASQSDSSMSLHALALKIEALEREIRRGRRTSRSISHSRRYSRARSNSRSRYRPGGKYCYFHFRLGKDCRPEKCVQPCKWNEQEN